MIVKLHDLTKNYNQVNYFYEDFPDAFNDGGWGGEASLYLDDFIKCFLKSLWFFSLFGRKFYLMFWNHFITDQF